MVDNNGLGSIVNGFIKKLFATPQIKTIDIAFSGWNHINNTVCNDGCINIVAFKGMLP